MVWPAATRARWSTGSFPPTMADTSNALPGGYRLNEYRIDSVLGAGGFGLTYLATDSNLDLKVAVKEYLPSEFASRADDSTVQPRSSSATDSFNWGLQRFMDEARTLASFRHPNIVRVMRFFEANSTGYMVMEFVEGEPLVRWIESRRPLSQAAILQIATPILDGLETIHRSGYLHRDIKPANVYIRSDGSPVLLDFGSARHVVSGGQELTAVVSPGYAPLEQYHTQGRQGPWTDIYAFGGVLYWMVSGNKPVEAAARVGRDILPPVAQTAGAVYCSNQLLAAIEWALRPGEEERPQRVAELLDALTAVEGRTVDLDVTIPVGAPPAPAVASRAATGATGLTGVSLDRGELKRMENELARYLGPIASVMVRSAAKKAPSISSLAEMVADEIADDEVRAAFLRSFLVAGGPERGGATSMPGGPPPSLSVSQKFSAATLKQAEATLAQHIGAIAKVVVNRAAARARDEAELYLLISDEIKDPVERRSFIRRAVAVSPRK